MRRRPASSPARGSPPAGATPRAAAPGRFVAVLAALLVMLLLPPAPVRAAELGPEERETLTERSKLFERLVVANDHLATVAAIPPAVIITLARAAGITPEEVRPRLANSLAGTARFARVESFEMDEDAVRVEETRTGLRYVLIPSDMVIEIAGLGRFQASDETLALEEFETWYFLRLDSPQQIALLVQTHPSFRGVAFNRGTITALPDN